MRSIAFDMMQHLHTQPSEIKRLEWEEMLWMTDRLYEKPPEVKKVGEPIPSEWAEE